MDDRHSLQPNQNIEIFVGKNDFRAVYKTRVEEVRADSLVLAMPMDKGFPIILPVGEYFQGKFVKDGAAYQFDCRYLDKRFTPLPVWITSLPINFEKIQMRNHVRVEVGIRVTMQIPDQEEAVVINTVTKDLSGGGALIVSKVPIPVGKQVFLTLILPEFGEVSMSGDVIRREQPKPDQQLYWLGIKFTDITEKQRNTIIKYVFKVQIQHRKKGL